MERLIELVPQLKVLEGKSPFYSNIKQMISYAEDVLKEIKNTFDNYTNHDIYHSFNVIKYMFDAVSDFEQLTDLEITVIIYVGLLHDIGMVVTDEEKEKLKNDKYELSKYNYSSVLNNCKGNEKIAIQEIIRPIHAVRSRAHILNKMDERKSFFEIPGVNGVYFSKIVGDICVAHNEEFEWIRMNLENSLVLGKYSINPQFIAILLRLADLLDIDSSRAPDYLYRLIAPKGISDDEWRQHFIITNSEKIVASDSGVKQIEFYGETEDAKIHRKLLNYFDWIKKELENATSFLNETPQKKYHLNISTNIRNFIRPQNFEFSNFKLSLDYKSITNLLMGENIYNDKRCGLREIIQNSIDACKLMKEETIHLDEFQYNNYKPEIIIRIDRFKKKVTIYDNGIGMSFEIIKKYFLNVGVSYYNSNDCKYRGYSYNPIGNYGIGFLSCFMLSNNIRIKSKRFDSSDTIIVDVEKDNEYVVFGKSSYDQHSFTEITLDETFFTVFDSFESVKSYIEEIFLDNSIDIIIQNIEADYSISKYCCNLTSLTSSEKEDVCLSKYLNGIEAYAMISKNISYIKSLDDFSTNNYIYKDGGFYKYDSEKHDIGELIYNNELTYATITFIPLSAQDKFESYCEVLDDYMEVINKLDDLDEINIFYNYNEAEFLVDGENMIVDLNYTTPGASYDREVFENGISVYDLLTQFDSDDLRDKNLYSFYASVGCEKIVGDSENKTYLIFDKDWYNHWLSKEKRYLYVRSVLINKYSFLLPFVASGIKINEIIVNILNNNIVPDISRSNIQEKVTKDINYALGKALHLWVLENISLPSSEKNTLKEFINLKYNENNILIADGYNGIIN